MIMMVEGSINLILSVHGTIMSRIRLLLKMGLNGRLLRVVIQVIQKIHYAGWSAMVGLISPEVNQEQNGI